MTAISDLEIKRFVAIYWEAVEGGALPVGTPISVGTKSALTVVAEATGWSASATRRRMLEAQKRGMLVKAPKVTVAASATPSIINLHDRVLGVLKNRKLDLASIAEAVKAEAHVVHAAIMELKKFGYRFDQNGNMWSLMKSAPQIASAAGGPIRTFMTKDDNTFSFGASSDQHIASKYERLDVVESLYDAFAEEEISTVFNAGNWLDGEAHFNRHDIKIHGIDQQMRYLVDAYPERAGITTYAITGDDHEGWWAKREGIDVGRYAERVMVEAGRQDWIDLGYMEAPVRLINANTGKEAIISIVHPGGGVPYATSYVPQKIIESYDGGEKPAMLIIGHHHKLLFMNVRNVWAFMSGCTQDQTPFMRKQKIAAHLGGGIFKIMQDPATGAITRCRCEIIRCFTKGYYAGRWSSHGSVNKAEVRYDNG